MADRSFAEKQPHAISIDLTLIHFDRPFVVSEIVAIQMERKGWADKVVDVGGCNVDAEIVEGPEHVDECVLIRRARDLKSEEVDRKAVLNVDVHIDVSIHEETEVTHSICVFGKGQKERAENTRPVRHQFGNVLFD